LAWLLIFDVLSFGIFSGIILIFQPITFLLRNSLIKKAKEKREKFKDLLVIGICGSYGKTSTKEFLATILEEKFPGKVLKTKEHQNSEVGISKCILEELKEDHKIFVAEMGVYNKGGIKLICKTIKPKIGIITGVNEQHLSLFGSMENLISGEGGKELIESLPEDGLVIFNGENEILRKIYQETKIKKMIVGISKKELDLWAENIKLEKENLSFKIFTKDGEGEEFNLNLIGAQNVQNLLLAICCAKELGLNLDEISRGIKKIRQEQSGVRLIKTKDRLNIVESTYSANPDSVISHLEYLKVWPGKRVIVMPCLIELGPASKEIHKKIGKKIYEVCDLAIIVTKDRFKEIKEGAKEKAIFLENPREIYEKIKQFDGENDIILFEGRLPKEFLNLVYGN
jgi:UDP-N-acetylmuramoyl-tripeptide--D-alanyl-D-alanine ligase